MPKMDAAIYAAHMDSVLKLAKRTSGVSRPQIINDLNVTRTVASGLIEKCNLVKIDGPGRTEFFSEEVAAAPVVKRSTPTVVKAVTVPVDDSTGEATDPLDAIEALDSQILETRTSLGVAAIKAGKSLSEWGTQQAIVDAMRVRLTELIVERLRASP